MNETETLTVPELDDASVVFGADVLDWMPTQEQIPDEFWRGHTEWNRIVSRWFFRGLPEGTEFVPKKDVDRDKALRAIKSVLGSWSPKHEHKEAAVAYMLSCWFKKVKGWDDAS